MSKKIHIIETIDGINENDISEIIVVKKNGTTTKATLLTEEVINLGFEIDLERHVKVSKDLDEIVKENFFDPYLEYIKIFDKIALNLSHNYLKDSQIKMIIQNLNQEKLIRLKNNLNVINLSSNSITKIGLMELFEFIESCPKMCHLYVDNNLQLRPIINKQLVVPDKIKGSFYYYDDTF